MIYSVKFRREEFCYLYENDAWGDGSTSKVLDKLVNDDGIFPRAEDKAFLFQYALDERHLKIITALEKGNFDRHEFRFEDGKSAVHYLAERSKSERVIKRVNRSLIKNFFLNHSRQDLFRNYPRKNYCDAHGYTYFHAACMVDDVRVVRKFLSQGVNVNLDTYTCSPLFIAAQYKNVEIAELLLEHRANPNQSDHEGSTPLHALALPCLCECIERFYYCDTRKPVDYIVKMLIDSGADIEARNRHGDTPLQSAVMRFDVALTKSLLDHGASLRSLNEKRMFIHNFSSLELTTYALSLDVIEVMQLLQSAGYKMDFHTKLRMVECWTRIHGNDLDRVLVKDSGRKYHSAGNKNQVVDIFVQMADQLAIHKLYGFYMKPEVKDYMIKRCKQLKPTVPEYWRNYVNFNGGDIIREHGAYLLNNALVLPKINDIKITEDVSLHKLSTTNYSEGYSILKNIKNWRVPQMDNLTCGSTFARFTVRRHLSNIAIRLAFDLELLAADLFMTDYCSLNLPHHICLKVAKNLGYEELFRLFEKINVDELEKLGESVEGTNQNGTMEHRTRFVRLAL
ncbi:serine/threonine-protein kinase TNNI3K-like [Trichogramma pretiosum]|uniref:serine/threonine-protein kinase TNNI3K-like n=1 Tax=Trichogramma pretiosum TaxID=7493 RepID=UPI0006C9C909|nr:serine/threonine-protein kinase TNNI3K-like [Trichogramma pretiosum]